MDDFSGTSNFTRNLTLVEEELITNQQAACYAVSAILLIVSFYILISLSLFEIKVQHENRCSLSSIRRDRRHYSRDRVTDWMRWLCLIASILLTVRISADVAETMHGDHYSFFCLVVRHIKGILQSAVLTSIFLTLWFRQRKFYKTPVMAHLTNRPVRFFSAAMIVLMTAVNLTTLILYLSTRTYKSSRRGCVVDQNAVPKILPGIFVFVSTFSFQAILLGLLIYPLIVHRQDMTQVADCAGNSNSSLMKWQSNEIALIRRVTTAAGIAVLTDITCGVISVYAFVQPYGAVRSVVYDVDQCVALICVIMSFANWKARLTPFLPKQHQVIGTIRKHVENTPRDQSTL